MSIQTKRIANKILFSHLMFIPRLSLSPVSRSYAKRAWTEDSLHYIGHIPLDMVHLEADIAAL
jgi:hypothetical protein